MRCVDVLMPLGVHEAEVLAAAAHQCSHEAAVRTRYRMITCTFRAMPGMGAERVSSLGERAWGAGHQAGVAQVRCEQVPSVSCG